MLSEGAHSVVGEASNGQEAVELFREHSPNLVIMDITMPEKDGLEALKEITQLDPNARVIICSALAVKKTAALELGAKEFVEKPFNIDHFREVVRRVLS